MSNLNARAQRSKRARQTARSEPVPSERLSTNNYQPSTTGQRLCPFAPLRLSPHNREVNSRLSHIQHWPQLAYEAGYSVSALAKARGVSVRTLERFFLSALGDTPRRWLNRLRTQKATELLGDGSTVKEIASRLGYEDPSHFSREFKNHYGFAPKGYANPPAKTAVLPKCRIRP